MDLTNIITDRAAAKAHFMGETLNFKYRPGLVTAEGFQKLETLSDVDELGTFFAELLVSWDMTKHGEAVAITPDVFATLPIQLIRAITTVIMEDVPQKDSGKD